MRLKKRNNQYTIRNANNRAFSQQQHKPARRLPKSRRPSSSSEEPPSGGTVHISSSEPFEAKYQVDQMIDNTSLTDLHLACDDGYVPVHRYLLMGVSPLLNSILIDKDPSDLVVVHLVETRVRHAVQLVALIYYGQCHCPNSEDKEELFKIMKSLGIPSRKIQYRRLNKVDRGASAGGGMPKPRFFEEKRNGDGSSQLVGDQVDSSGDFGGPDGSQDSTSKISGGKQCEKTLLKQKDNNKSEQKSPQKSLKRKRQLKEEYSSDSDWSVKSMRTCESSSVRQKNSSDNQKVSSSSTPPVPAAAATTDCNEYHKECRSDIEVMYALLLEKQKPLKNTFDPNCWPRALQAFRNYVKLCHSVCANKADKNRCDESLKGKLVRASAQGILVTKNWNVERVPSFLDEQLQVISQWEYDEKRKSSKVESPVDRDRRAADETLQVISEYEKEECRQPQSLANRLLSGFSTDQLEAEVATRTRIIVKEELVSENEEEQETPAMSMTSNEGVKSSLGVTSTSTVTSYGGGGVTSVKKKCDSSRIPTDVLKAAAAKKLREREEQLQRDCNVNRGGGGSEELCHCAQCCDCTTEYGMRNTECIKMKCNKGCKDKLADDHRHDKQSTSDSRSADQRVCHCLDCCDCTQICDFDECINPSKRSSPQKSVRKRFLCREMKGGVLYNVYCKIDDSSKTIYVPVDDDCVSR